MTLRDLRLRVVLSAFVSAFAFLVIPSITTGQSTPTPPVLSAQARAQISQILREKKTRTPAQKKIQSTLLYAARLAANPRQPNLSTLTLGMPTAVNGRVVVDVVGRVTDSLIERLTAQGATILTYDFKYPNVRAEVPLANLETIASWSDVRSIRQKQRAVTTTNLATSSQLLAAPKVSPGLLAKVKPGFAQRAANVRANLQAALKSVKATHAVNVSEGVVTHKADQVVQQFGVIGTGVKVGVLSDGVSSLAAIQASGDLPGVFVLPGQEGAGDEGTAMLEIVHDMAPGAKLYFGTAFNSITSFAQNIQDLRAAGCDIIVDDVFYFTETPFQTGQSPTVASTTNAGIVIEAVNNVTASGALYFSSAGNEGNLDDATSGTWAGDFVDGGPNGIEDGSIHLFAPGLPYDQLTSTAPFGVFTLEWSDPLGGSSNDYDLFVLDPTGSFVVGFSADVQDGTQDPFEGLDAGGAVPGGYLWVIIKFSGADRFLHFATYRGTLAVGTDQETHGHSATPTQYAFTIAATPAAGAFGPGAPVGPFPGPFTSANVVEPFSSDGYRRVFFHADSSPITPGDFSSTGGQLYLKPDLTAADGVSCAAPGFNPFFGTSAAAPHAAAIAALVKSAKPSYTQSDVANALTSTAIDIMAPGVDRDSGAGIIDALAAVASTGVTPQAVLTLGDLDLNEANGNGNGGVEPGECGALQVELVDGNALIGASAISATLTTSTPGITIDVPTVTYPDIPGGGSAVGDMRFRFGLASSVSCPLTVQFTLTVTFTGGASPQVLTFAVRTGSPAVVSTTTLNNTAPAPQPGIYAAITGIQTQRLARDGVANVCGNPKDYPDVLGGTGNRRFDAYTFTNCQTGPACVSVTLQQDGNGKLQAVGYFDSYDPTNLAQNYAGDAGGSAPITQFSFEVGPGQQFAVVVDDTVIGPETGNPYRLTIDGVCLPCHNFNGNGQCCPDFTFLPAGPALPPGIAGQPYPPTHIRTPQGQAPYTFVVTGLPPGLIATNTGNDVVISGTPFLSFSGTIDVSGTDNRGCMFHTSYTLSITCDPSSPSVAPMTVASAVCAGSAGNVASVPDAGTGATYNWTIINGTITSGQGTAAIAFTATTGVGPVELTAVASLPSGCSFFSHGTVVVTPIPAAPSASNNGPLSPGQTLNLMASTISGAAYSWTGPAGFASTDQNPSISNVTTANAGIYSVTVTVNGCTSPAATTTVVITGFNAIGFTIDTPLSIANNGVFEPGEVALFVPSWHNGGPAHVDTPGTLSLFTGPGLASQYSIVDGSSDYSADAGSTVNCSFDSDCYQLQVTGPRPSTHWDATVTETLGTGDSKAWTIHIGDSFTDVPSGTPQYRFVETILHNGVTAGCTVTTFCPGNDVSRQQMAVLLLISKQGIGYTPPACTTPAFADVPCSSPFAPWVNELANRGVVAGCGNGNYCPTDSVTRAPMSVFILRTLHGSSFNPPPCVTPVFADVPCSNMFAPWINELQDEGITNGCAPGLFCPTGTVSRGQMAVFLVTAFTLKLY